MLIFCYFGKNKLGIGFVIGEKTYTRVNQPDSGYVFG